MHFEKKKKEYILDILNFSFTNWKEEKTIKMIHFLLMKIL